MILSISRSYPLTARRSVPIQSIPASVDLRSTRAQPTPQAILEERFGSSDSTVRSMNGDRVPPQPAPIPMVRNRLPTPKAWRPDSTSRLDGTEPIHRPCQPKRARVMPPPAHVWNPHGLVDPEQLAAYEDYKRSSRGNCKYYILFIVFFDKYTWSRDELAVVRGELPLGIRPWHDVDIVLIPCNVGGMHWVMASIDLQLGTFLCLTRSDEVPFRHRNAQFACLRYLLPSQLYTVHFHRNRQPGDKTYKKKDGPFRMLFVSADRVPQQELGGNCGAHTLRMIEYLTANRDTFDWTEADMPIIRQKMAIEVYCNSRIL
ncbi:hypothetical protein LWI29_020132 [Acer saccharum]|uniref:Ubiquitin-like protease family profile domain-containing protein n=1 Tax=Acer saccharum TaxID=4024 RepID=A0AA39TFQ2_ACESA|nr:hypothetical protein LWI29_020132 [Acer saccharum]